MLPFVVFIAFNSVQNYFSRLIKNIVSHLSFEKFAAESDLPEGDGGGSLKLSYIFSKRNSKILKWPNALTISWKTKFNFKNNQKLKY